MDDPEEIGRVVLPLGQLLMPLLAGAALGGDLTNQTEGPEKASQLIRDPVGTSGNSLAVKTATSNCLEEFCVFLGFFATLFVFTLA